MDEKKVVVLDMNEQHSKALCTMLEAKQYHAVPMQSLDSIQGYIQKHNCLAVILDVDNEFVRNRSIRQLTVDNPGVYFFVMSQHSYNPELEESITRTSKEKLPSYTPTIIEVFIIIGAFSAFLLTYTLGERFLSLKEEISHHRTQ